MHSVGEWCEFVSAGKQHENARKNKKTESATPLPKVVNCDFPAAIVVDARFIRKRQSMQLVCDICRCAFISTIVATHWFVAFRFHDPSALTTIPVRHIDANLIAYDAIIFLLFARANLLLPFIGVHPFVVLCIGVVIAVANVEMHLICSGWYGDDHRQCKWTPKSFAMMKYSTHKYEFGSILRTRTESADGN